MLVAQHLGGLSQGFLSGFFVENMMENIEETHCVLNCDNARTLGFWGDTHVMYADVMRGGESTTLGDRISGGRRSAIEDPMLIFTNAGRSFPMKSIPDNISGVTYQTCPKGWMDRTLFPHSFEKPRAFQSDIHGSTTVVWCDIALATTTHHSSLQL